MRDGLFHGIVPMQVTPFHDDGWLDLDGLAQAIEWQATLDVTSLSALGMAGEFYKLATDELEAVISTVVGASGALKTLVGVSAPSSDVAARLARHAARAGADGLLVLPPYAIKPSADEIIAYYAAIARAADLPIMAQDGSDEIRAVLPFDTLVRLCRESRLSLTSRSRTSRHRRRSAGSARFSATTPSCSAGRGDLRFSTRTIEGRSGASRVPRRPISLRGSTRASETDRLLAESRYREILPLIQFQCQSTELFIASEKRIFAPPRI